VHAKILSIVYLQHFDKLKM